MVAQMVCVTYRGFEIATVTAHYTTSNIQLELDGMLLNLDARAARFLCHSLEQALRLLRASFLQMPSRLAHQALQCLTPPFPLELAAPKDERLSMLAAQPDLSRPVGDQGSHQPPTPAVSFPGPQQTCTLPAQPLALQLPYPKVNSEVPDSNTMQVGGAGMRVADISTASEVIYSLHGYTLVISRANLALHGLELGDIPSRQRVLNLLPIRLGCRYTTTQWWATPGDVFCGLHSILRLQSALAPSVKQKPNLQALITLITNVLPSLSVTEDWPYELAALQITRNYLEHTLQLLLAGHRTASETDYMPLEALRVLTSWHPVPVAFWIPDSAQPDEVWITRDSGLPGTLTMASLQRLVGGSHIAFSRRHFFHLDIDPVTVQTLLDAALGTHAQITSTDPILPMEVEEGALLVQRAGADWAVVLSPQHRQCLRRDSAIALVALIPTHLRIHGAVWAAVEGNGYCGYEAIRQILLPGSPPFRLSDPDLRSALQQFLLLLLQQMPMDLSADLHTRVRAAAAHLDTDRMQEVFGTKKRYIGCRTGTI
jgi:hypothetical protein